MLLIFTFFLFLLIKSQCHSITSSPSQCSPTSPPSQSTFHIQYNSNFSSVLGIPLQIHEFNYRSNSEINPTFLIHCTIHGNEQPGYLFCKGLIERWDNNPSLVGTKHIIMVPVANPDGHNSSPKVRYNANNIDLNRNFPTDPFHKSSTYHTGERGGSEPETQLLLCLIHNRNVRRAVAYHSCRSDGCQQVNYDARQSQAMADLMGEKSRYRVSGSWDQPTPNSFGTFMAYDLKLPVVTMEFPSSFTGSFQPHFEAIEAAIAMPTSVTQSRHILPQSKIFISTPNNIIDATDAVENLWRIDDN